MSELFSSGSIAWPSFGDIMGKFGICSSNSVVFPTDDDLWEVIGFCRRYGIGMTQLAKFETDENSTWMRDPKMVWHAEIFGDLGSPNGK
jgi:hypothetical protein